MHTIATIIIITWPALLLAAILGWLAWLHDWRACRAREARADREIAAAIIDLSHRLGIEVTAEGVEDGRTAELLAGMGCDYIQGFLHAPALPLTDFVAWVRARECIGRQPVQT